jgi:acyl carrier protein
MMEGTMEELIGELKVKIVATLNLISVAPDSIDAEALLVGGELGLDSIDVLELVMMIEKDYGLRIDNKELGIRVFASLKALAEYIHQNRPETSP